jgi:hypothetical protein
LLEAVAMSESVLSAANSKECRPPNTEGNSKANQLKSAISKTHSLKEMRALPEDQRRTVADSGHPGENFAHHRRVLSSLNPYVQHIEHMFKPLSPSTGAGLSMASSCSIS